MVRPEAQETRSTASTPNVAEYTVSELAGAIKRALEDGFGYVRLRGEISGYRGPHASGHCYFALKDDKAKIEAVIWRGTFQRLRIKPEEGMEVIVHGRVTTYPGSSKYQIVVEALEPAGLGALMALIEERKKKLAAEGLFDEARKKKIPFLPAVIGIVTSPTGAVIRDMLHGFNERFPAHVIVWPVRVQGEGSAAEVAAAIRGFNAICPGGQVPRPDVLIVARGGGSLEDLWSFNEEIVVRAAAASEIPLIAAVGHETDWTLIDYAADARAPTPTKAAEWAVPKYSELVESTAKLALRQVTAVRRVLEAAGVHLKAASRGLPRLQDLVALPRQRFDACERRLGRALLANTRSHAMRQARIAARLQPRLLEVRLGRMSDRLDGLARRSREALARFAGSRRVRLERVSGRLQPATIRQRLARSAERLDGLDGRRLQAFRNGLAHHRRRLDGQMSLFGSLSYHAVLRRGFAIIRDSEGRMVRQAVAVAVGDRLDVELSDGHVGVKAERVDPSHGKATVAGDTESCQAGDASRAGRGQSPAKKGKPDQGSLF